MLIVSHEHGHAYADGVGRQDRWQHVMGSLVELVRFESAN
jgi:hypothetical protein